MNTHTSLDSYSGVTLEAWLDDIESMLFDNNETNLVGVDRQQFLRELLIRPRFRPDTLNSTVRLANLWLQAGDLNQALRIADIDGERALASLPADERSEAMIDFGFWRISAIAEHLHSSAPSEDRVGMLADALHAMENRLTSLPLEEQHERAWQRLADLAYEHDQFECTRRCAIARHSWQLAQTGRAAYRAHDQATLALRLGHSLRAEGRAEAANQAAAEAFDALAKAAPGQDIDYRDWLNLGRSLLKLRPDLLEPLTERVLTLLPTALSPGLRRVVQVLLARLKARVLFEAGEIDGALTWGRGGRYGLSQDDDDSFSAEYMDWLLAAQRFPEAAQLAYDSIDCERKESANHACRLALQQLEFDATSPDKVDAYWHLALANAATHENTQWICGNEAPDKFHVYHLRRAQELAAVSSSLDQGAFSAAVAALQAHQLLQDGRDYPAALALLDLATGHPAHANSKNVESLWRCRMRLYGAVHATQMPFVPCTSAGWNYDVAVSLEHNLRSLLPDDAPWPKEGVEAIGAQYYELGLAQFEAFFSGQEGRFMDAHTHAYSMLCNNLAIFYYWKIDDPEEIVARAIPLHERGIATSPFSEHYNGILNCMLNADDKPGLIAAAESLWQFAEDHGYSRHDPIFYMGAVAYALHQLDRGLEIGIWLQRLDQWWNDLDADEKDERAVSYISAKTIALGNFMKWNTEDALPRLNALLPQILATRDPDTIRLAGCGLESAGRVREAMEMYRKAIALTRRGDELQDLIRDKCLTGIEDCKQKLKPRWQFWG